MRKVYYGDSVGDAHEGWFHQWIVDRKTYAIVEKPDGGIVLVKPSLIAFKDTPQADQSLAHRAYPKRKPETETSKIWRI